MIVSYQKISAISGNVFRIKIIDVSHLLLESASSTTWRRSAASPSHRISSPSESHTATPTARAPTAATAAALHVCIVRWWRIRLAPSSPSLVVPVITAAVLVTRRRHASANVRRTAATATNAIPFVRHRASAAVPFSVAISVSLVSPVALIAPVARGVSRIPLVGPPVALPTKFAPFETWLGLGASLPSRSSRVSILGHSV